MRSSGLALLAACAAGVAGAQPLLLMDTAFIHGEEAASRPEADLPLRASVPADWSAPVAYATATAHFRLEIRHKPTAVAIRYQPCLERGTSRACAPAQQLADSGATRAVYAWSQPLPQWTPAMNWASRPERLVLVLQDAYGRPITPVTPGGPVPPWVGQPFMTLYYPMSVRFSAALMPQGAAFPGWPALIPVAVGPPRPQARNRPVRLGRAREAGIFARTARGPRDMRGRMLPFPARSRDHADP